MGKIVECAKVDPFVRMSYIGHANCNSLLMLLTHRTV